MNLPEREGYEIVSHEIDGGTFLGDHEGVYYKLKVVYEPIKPKRVFKDGAFYGVLHRSDNQNDIVEYDKQKDTFLTINWGECTIGAFNWIGEELEIKWGES